LRFDGSHTPQTKCMKYTWFSRQWSYSYYQYEWHTAVLRHSWTLGIWHFHGS